MKKIDARFGAAHGRRTPDTRDAVADALLPRTEMGRTLARIDPQAHVAGPDVMADLMDRTERERDKAVEKYGRDALAPGGREGYDVLDYAANETAGLMRYAEMIRHRYRDNRFAARLADDMQAAGMDLAKRTIRLRLALLDAGLTLGTGEPSHAPTPAAPVSDMAAPVPSVDAAGEFFGAEPDEAYTFAGYQADASRTMKADDRDRALTHYALGLAGEAGEAADAIKKLVFYGLELTEDRRTEILKEIGDTMWYAAALATTLGAPMGGVARQNIAKLRARYPEQFNAADAVARRDGTPRHFDATPNATEAAA